MSSRSALEIKKNQFRRGSRDKEEIKRSPRQLPMKIRTSPRLKCVKTSTSKSSGTLS